MIWFMQCRIPKLQTMFLVPFVQCLMMVWTAVCSVSRITDHRHHVTDVIGGAILGVIFSVYTCHILSRNFCYCDTTTGKPASVNMNGSAGSNRRSVRRLLSTISAKEEFTLNNLE